MRRGTFTLLSGSRSLPEVKQAMYDASFYFVQMDEMMQAVGEELGQLYRRGMGHSDHRLRSLDYARGGGLHRRHRS